MPRTKHEQDITKPKYTQADVMRAIPSLKAGTFQMWMARGIVKPTLDNPGPGQKRRFSAEDIMRLAIMTVLVEFNITTSAAAHITKYRGWLRDSSWREAEWMVIWRIPEADVGTLDPALWVGPLEPCADKYSVAAFSTPKLSAYIPRVAAKWELCLVINQVAIVKRVLRLLRGKG